MLLHGVSVKTCIGFAAMRLHNLSYNQQLARQTCPRAWDRLRRTTLMAYLKQNVKNMISSFKLHSPEIFHQPVPKWGFLSWPQAPWWPGGCAGAATRSSLRGSQPLLHLPMGQDGSGACCLVSLGKESYMASSYVMKPNARKQLA